MNSGYLDDAALIKLFVTGQVQLAANANLRVQSALDTSQLLASNGQILAISRPKTDPQEIGVRPKSKYTELLDKTLRESSFLMVGVVNSQRFIRYNFQSAPAGYRLYCEPARLLWRQWWIRYRQTRFGFLQMDLLVFTQQQWYPVRNIILSQSMLFVTTYRGETIHQQEDLVIWAEKVADATERLTQLPATAQIQSKDAQAVTAKPLGSSISDAKPRMQPRAPAKLATVVGELPKHLQQIARYEKGKLYIKTALGEVVVEGANLRCTLKTSA